MRLPIFALFLAASAPQGWSQALSDVDREALLERLENLSDTASQRVDARFRSAMSAFASAMNSDEAAYDLYIKCVEKVDFEDQKKKNLDFREWRRKEDEKLSKPGFKLALRHQLRWLVLTLQAASEKADRTKLAGDAQQLVDAIFRDAEQLAGHQQELKKPVTASVFARAYEIDSLKIEKWPMSPLELQQVYNELLLPPYRTPGTLSQLRATWIKRIQQEGMTHEFWSASSRANKGAADGKETKPRIGMADDMRPPEYDKFVADTLPKLQWEMEVDLFKNGDQVGAASRMLAHLEKYIAHPSATEWTKQFRELLNPAEEEPAKGEPAKDESKPVS